jgi:hypothetical protein
MRSEEQLELGMEMKFAMEMESALVMQSGMESMLKPG